MEIRPILLRSTLSFLTNNVLRVLELFPLRGQWNIPFLYLAHQLQFLFGWIFQGPQSLFNFVFQGAVWNAIDRLGFGHTHFPTHHHHNSFFQQLSVVLAISAAFLPRLLVCKVWLWIQRIVSPQGLAVSVIKPVFLLRTWVTKSSAALFLHRPGKKGTKRLSKTILTKWTWILGGQGIPRWVCPWSQNPHLGNLEVKRWWLRKGEAAVPAGLLEVSFLIGKWLCQKSGGFQQPGYVFKALTSLTVGFEFEEGPEMSFGIPGGGSISGAVVMAERWLSVALQIGLLFDVQRVCKRWGRLITGGVADILPPPPIL